MAMLFKHLIIIVCSPAELTGHDKRVFPRAANPESIVEVHYASMPRFVMQNLGEYIYKPLTKKLNPEIAADKFAQHIKYELGA
jgi:hypothetical protein